MYIESWPMALCTCKPYWKYISGKIEWPFLKQTYKTRKKLVLGVILVHVGSWGVTPSQPIFRDIDLAPYHWKNMIETSIFEANISKQEKIDFLGEILVNIGSWGVTPSENFFRDLFPLPITYVLHEKIKFCGIKVFNNH